ncbi:MAG: YciI family protein [Candidatus Binataceae bacterium]
MQYILFLCSNDDSWADYPGGEPAVIRAHNEVINDLKNRSKFKSSNALHLPDTAATIRVRSGKTMVTDGPFAETKEQIRGYYLVDAKDLDEAIAIAARIPDAQVGSVEIRPIRVFD